MECSYRQANAPDLFLGAYQLDGSTRTLVGYVCATQTPHTSLTHESMSHHVPGSASICIHSVCVAPSQRKKGLGLALLEEYIRRAERARADGVQTWERIVLITHEELIPFYEKAGFENLGKSSVVHGPYPWFEMRHVLKASASGSEHPEQMVQNQIPAGVYEALQRRRTDVPSSQMIYDFANGVMDVVDSATDGAPLNKFDLLCPRAGCGSIILKAGTAKWVERESEQVRFLCQILYACLINFANSWSLQDMHRTHIYHRFLPLLRLHNYGLSLDRPWSSRILDLLAP